MNGGRREREDLRAESPAILDINVDRMIRHDSGNGHTADACSHISVDSLIIDTYHWQAILRIKVRKIRKLLAVSGSSLEVNSVTRRVTEIIRGTSDNVDEQGRREEGGGGCCR